MDASAEIMAIRNIVEIASGLTVTGLLVVIVVAFFRGMVVPKSQVDEMRERDKERVQEIKEHAETQTTLLAMKMADSINQGTEKAVAMGTEKGIVAAVEFLNGGKEKSKVKE